MTDASPDRVGSRDAKHPWLWLLATVLVVVAGFGLRAAYYDRGWGHPDEIITVEVVGYMRQSGDWDTNWAKANLEPSFRYDQYNFSGYLYGTYFFYRLAKLVPGTEAWRAWDGGWYVYRFFSVVLGTLVVWQTWRVARRLGAPRVALLAAAMVAIVPLLVQDAHFARPESFVTALTVAVVACCWPRANLNIPAMLGGGILIGLLIATKVSMLLLAWMPVVPIFAATTGPARRWWWLLAIPIAVVLGFALGAPGAIAKPNVFLYGVQELTKQYASGHAPHGHIDGSAVGDLLGSYFVATLGWPAIAAAVVGVASLMVKRRGWEALLLVGPPVLFAGYFASRSVFFERNLSHVVPLFMILAALGVERLAALSARGHRRRAVAFAFVGLALVAITPLTVTLPLVLTEFSGAGGDRRSKIESEIRGRFPDAEWKSGTVITHEPTDELARHFASSRRPVLFRVNDYPDDFSQRNLVELTRRFACERVGYASSSFPTLPICTLLTYHGSGEIYFLISDLKRD